MRQQSRKRKMRRRHNNQTKMANLIKRKQSKMNSVSERREQREKQAKWERKTPDVYRALPREVIRELQMMRKEITA